MVSCEEEVSFQDPVVSAPILLPIRYQTPGWQRAPVPKKGDDPVEGTSQSTLSADDRDAIVESLLQRLTSLKEKSDPPHTEDLSKFYRHFDAATHLPGSCLPNSHVSCQHALQQGYLKIPPNYVSSHSIPHRRNCLEKASRR